MSDEIDEHEAERVINEICSLRGPRRIWILLRHSQVGPPQPREYKLTDPRTTTLTTAELL